jgi:hypothetical protein
MCVRSCRSPDCINFLLCLHACRRGETPTTRPLLVSPVAMRLPVLASSVLTPDPPRPATSCPSSPMIHGSTTRSTPPPPHTHTHTHWSHTPTQKSWVTRRASKSPCESFPRRPQQSLALRVAPILLNGGNARSRSGASGHRTNRNSSSRSRQRLREAKQALRASLLESGSTTCTSTAVSD